ncbi:hypothetical protein Fcan01_27863 [Folsomia candida]|uniref:Uncharacterized protein n=1 Tax=Folsomia candida TaxID=158441 RepID=A0A226CY00_FOLCA|nr:hypothetical protein Fcan01_27863 [Folsomia candida]
MKFKLSPTSVIASLQHITPRIRTYAFDSSISTTHNPGFAFSDADEEFEILHNPKHSTTKPPPNPPPINKGSGAPRFPRITTQLRSVPSSSNANAEFTPFANPIVPAPSELHGDGGIVIPSTQFQNLPLFPSPLIPWDTDKFIWAFNSTLNRWEPTTTDHHLYIDSYAPTLNPLSHHLVPKNRIYIPADIAHKLSLCSFDDTRYLVHATQLPKWTGNTVNVQANTPPHGLAAATFFETLGIPQYPGATNPIQYTSQITPTPRPQLYPSLSPLSRSRRHSASPLGRSRSSSPPTPLTTRPAAQKSSFPFYPSIPGIPTSTSVIIPTAAMYGTAPPHITLPSTGGVGGSGTATGGPGVGSSGTTSGGIGTGGGTGAGGGPGAGSGGTGAGVGGPGPGFAGSGPPPGGPGPPPGGSGPPPGGSAPPPPPPPGGTAAGAHHAALYFLPVMTFDPPPESSRYDGTTSVKEFLEYYYIVGLSQGWAGDKYSLSLPLYVKGPVLDWYRTYKSEQAKLHGTPVDYYTCPWHTLDAALRVAFQSREVPELQEAQLACHKLTPDMTPEAYFYKAMRLIDKLDKHMNLTRKIRYLIAGLPSDMAR